MTEDQVAGMPPLLEDQAAAQRSKLQPRLSQVQLTTAQLHKFFLLSILSTAENTVDFERANLDMDEKPAAKDVTHTAAAEKADVERAAEKVDVERAAEMVDVERAAADQAAAYRSFLLSNLSTAENAAEKADVERSAAFRSKPQPRLSPVQFTTSKPHKSPLLSNLSTVEDATEKADRDED